MAALVLRIKFPVTYPLIYKTLRVDANFTVKEAVRFIAETVNVTSLLCGSEGLYVPDEALWLDDNTILSTYKTLQEAEHIEFKDRNEKNNQPVVLTNNNANRGGGGDSDCCVLF